MRVSVAVSIAVVGVLGVAGCSGDDDDEGGAAPPTDDTGVVETTDSGAGGEGDGESPGGGGGPVNGVWPCDELYAEGRAVTDILDAGGCTDGEAVNSIDLSIDTCVDGRELIWNDLGWGFSDASWALHAAGATEPPAADLTACRG